MLLVENSTMSGPGKWSHVLEPPPHTITHGADTHAPLFKAYGATAEISGEHAWDGIMVQRLSTLLSTGTTEVDRKPKLSGSDDPIRALGKHEGMSFRPQV